MTAINSSKTFNVYEFLASSLLLAILQATVLCIAAVHELITFAKDAAA